MKLSSVSSKDVDVKVKDYNFKLTASMYNFSWNYNGSSLLLILDYHRPIVACVRETGRNKLRVTLHSSIPITNSAKYFELAEEVLGISEDLSEYYNLWRNDPLFIQAYNVLRGIHVRLTPLWLGLLIGICQQNASFRQGWSMLALIHKILGRKVEVEYWGLTIIPPTPKDIIKAGPFKLKLCKLGYRSDTIINVAEAFNSGALSDDDAKRYSDKDLMKIKGIGSYTSRLALVLSARKYEYAPIDRWLKRIISVVYSVPEWKAEEAWIKKWGRWSGLAALMLTVVLDAEPLSAALNRIQRKQLKPLFIEDKITPLTLWKYM